MSLETVLLVANLAVSVMGLLTVVYKAGQMGQKVEDHDRRIGDLEGHAWERRGDTP